MSFKDMRRAEKTLENMKDIIEKIEDEMNDDLGDALYLSHLTRKLANQANELKKMAE